MPCARASSFWLSSRRACPTPRRLHRVAQRSGRRADFDHAIAAYEELLRAHPGSPHAYEVLYFDGEARYAIADWPGAADRYARALALRPHDPRSPEAAYAYVLATRRAHGLVEKDPDPACDELGEPKMEAIPAAALPILAAYDTYLGLVAESPDRASILFAKAKIRDTFTDLDAGDLDRAPDSSPEAALRSPPSGV